MAKKTCWLILIFSLWLLPVLALGADSNSLTNNGANDDFFYGATWDDRVLDFTLKSLSDGQGQADTLLALTLKNNGAARNDFEITAVKLWADDYAAGWQGWGFDREVATARFVNDSWYFSDLRLAVPAEGLRLFVTIDVRNYVSAKKTVQFYIPQLADNDSDGVYDAGDQGIFMTSGLNGPTQNFMNEKWQAVNVGTIDVWAPQAAVTNLTNNQSLTVVAGGSYLITGQGRDQGRGQVAEVKVGIGTAADNLVWGEATNTGADFSTWSYNWQNIQPGTYLIKTQSRDGSGNLSAESYSWTVTVPPVVSPLATLADGTLARGASDGAGLVNLIKGGKKCLIANDAIFNSWGYDKAKVVEADLNAYADGEPVKFRDGYLIKGADAKVYVVSQGQKRWISDGAVFEGLGYNWNKINSVTAAELAQYADGEVVTKTYIHPAGTLIKYATYPEVFLLANGQRRHVANEATFLGLGYHWDNIITVPDWEYYPDAAEVVL